MADALGEGRQLIARHGFKEGDVDDGLAGFVCLVSVVLLHRGRAVHRRVHASDDVGLGSLHREPGLAANTFRLGQAGLGPMQQGVLARIREAVLYLLAGTAVLPPVQSKHDDDGQNAKGDEPGL